MTLLNAADMSKALADSGKVALYGIHFDTEKDTLRPDSESVLKEIGKLLADNPGLKIHVVGHTDDQGKPDYNLDLSRRRAAAVMHELTSRYGIAVNASGLVRMRSVRAGGFERLGAGAGQEPSRGTGQVVNRRVSRVVTLPTAGEWTGSVMRRLPRHSSVLSGIARAADRIPV